MSGPTVPLVIRAAVVAALAPRDVCPETTQLFAEMCADRRARERAHLVRIEAEAHRLGQEVAGYRTTMQDATARLERLCDRLDDTSTVPLRLVPLAIGRQVARAAFAFGMASAERRAS